MCAHDHKGKGGKGRLHPRERNSSFWHSQLSVETQLVNKQNVIVSTSRRHVLDYGNVRLCESKLEASPMSGKS